MAGSESRIIAGRSPTGEPRVVEVTAAGELEVTGGATQYQEDAPSASGDLGMMGLAIRNDAGGTLVDANGDYAPLQVNAAGQLIIAGGAGGTSMADDAPFAPGTTQITPMGAMLDDVAPDTVDEGDAGIPRMSANRNLYVRLRDNAGNERGLNVDAGGRLGANAHDGAGAALTSTLIGADQALDVNIVAGAGAGGTSMVDDAAFTPEVTAFTPVGGMLDDVAPDSIGEGDAGVVRMSANRNLYTTVRDAAGNERGLNVDANNRIGITNTVLSVVGGGAEATAQRVTIANDSTGVLSVDDNGGSLTVDQATHDNLQCNANIQVGDADVANGNPVPISDAGGSITIDGAVTIQEPLSVDDNGGSLTVDNAALSVVGGGAEATAQRVTIANDSTGVLTVDDGGASLTVDNPALSVVGGGAEAAALRVTIANDSTGLVSVDDGGASLSVDDAGGSLTVDNPALSVVGGGAEATAQRVTIANDSTGVLSVDDNAGSLTVDQATHDNLQCNANVQVGDVDVAVGNPVPVAGTAAEDAACAGNPVLVGGRYHASIVAADAVDDGDAVRLLVDSVGGVVKGHRADAWNANDNYAAAQTDTIVKAAPGANLALYVTDILFSTDTAMNIFLEAAAAIITPKVYLAVNGGWSAHFQTPIRWTTNTAITITSSAAGNHSVLILGYTAP